MKDSVIIFTIAEITGETIFRRAENYRFFLKRYAHYIEAIAATYAYCLLPNHFHLLVRIREMQTRQVSKTWQALEPSKAFSNLFNSYSKAFNRRYDRTGSLFQKLFRRKRVASERYFVTLVVYIHQMRKDMGWLRIFATGHGHHMDRWFRNSRPGCSEMMYWIGLVDELNLLKQMDFRVDEEMIAGLIGDD